VILVQFTQVISLTFAVDVVMVCVYKQEYFSVNNFILRCIYTLQHEQFSDGIVCYLVSL